MTSPVQIPAPESTASVTVTDSVELAHSGTTDRALVCAAQRGNRDAVTTIYQRYWRVVHAAILTRIPPQEAEDLLQDVFAAAVRRLETLRDGDSLGGWLLTIARNRTADYWRRSKTTSELPAELGVSGPPVAEANQVLERIRALPDTYSEILIMRFVEGFTGPEIAELTGMTHGSVRVNLHRGMTLLRKELGTEDV